MRRQSLPLLFLLPACAAPSFESPADVAALCAERAPEPIAFDVFFNDREGCDWDAEDSIAPDQGVYTAYNREISVVDEAQSVVMCSLDFDFDRGFEYGDDFFLTWNDAVLLSNREATIEEFSNWLRYPLWEWEDIVELQIPTSQTFRPFCAGEDEGDADCEVPRKPQGDPWEGDLEYEPDPSVVHELSFRSWSLGALEIDLITTGDNDDDDCFNEELDLEVTGTGIVL